MGLKKSLYIGLGLVSTVLGVIGIFLPILPTVPFLLLAAWSFERGSETLHNWIIHHKHLGPPIEEWQQHGVIRKKPKIVALSLIAISFGYVLIYRDLVFPVKVFLATLGVAVSLFIATRPTSPRQEKLNEN